MEEGDLKHSTTVEGSGRLKENQGFGTALRERLDDQR